MSNKLKARPKFNKTSKKWRVEVEKEGNYYPLGSMVGEGPFFRHSEWDTKEDAIAYINGEDKLEVENED